MKRFLKICRFIFLGCLLMLLCLAALVAGEIFHENMASSNPRDFYIDSVNMEEIFINGKMSDNNRFFLLSTSVSPATYTHGLFKTAFPEYMDGVSVDSILDISVYGDSLVNLNSFVGSWKLPENDSLDNYSLCLTGKKMDKYDIHNPYYCQNLQEIKNRMQKGVGVKLISIDKKSPIPKYISLQLANKLLVAPVQRDSNNIYTISGMIILHQIRNERKHYHLDSLESDIYLKNGILPEY